MPINPDSSTQFANEPLIQLIGKPLHQMTQDELRQYSLELRTLAKSPQALGRKIRQESKEAEEEDESAGEIDLTTGEVILPSEGVKRAKSVKKTAAPQGSMDDLMKELGG